MTTENLLRKKEVAKMLACSLRTVDRLVNAGRLDSRENSLAESVPFEPGANVDEWRQS